MELFKTKEGKVIFLLPITKHEANKVYSLNNCNGKTMKKFYSYSQESPVQKVVDVTLYHFVR